MSRPDEHRSDTSTRTRLSRLATGCVVATALADGYRLITHDRQLAAYGASVTLV